MCPMITRKALNQLQANDRSINTDFCCEKIERYIFSCAELRKNSTQFQANLNKFFLPNFMQIVKRNLN